MTRKLFLLLLLAATCAGLAAAPAGIGNPIGVSATPRATEPPAPTATPVAFAAAPASDPMDAGDRAVIQYLDALKQTQIAAGEADTRKDSGAQAAEPAAASPAVSSDSDPGAFLACVRQRESRGDYGAINSSSGSAGAYQFLPSTFDATARHMGRDDLVGRDPASVSPADQDAAAEALYEWQGTAPWGGSCS